MVDTLEEVAAVLRAFIRSAGQGTAQPLFDPTKTNTIGPGQLNVGPGSGPRATDAAAIGNLRSVLEDAHG
jgi:hypothetical protein